MFSTPRHAYIQGEVQLGVERVGVVATASVACSLHVLEHVCSGSYVSLCLQFSLCQRIRKWLVRLV